MQMAAAFKSKGFLRLLLRGVLGGVSGALVLAFVEVCIIRPSGWDNWLGYFLLIFIVSLPFGVIAGVGLSGALWLVYDKTGIHFRLLTRGLLGTVIGMVMIGIWWAMTANPYKQSYEKHSWIVDSLGLILLGAAFGGIPGLLIGSQRQRDSNSRVNTVNQAGDHPS